MKHFWMGIVLICVVLAALSLWQQHYDAAFVMGTVGALAWFLNYRVRVKEVIREKDKQDNDDGESNESTQN